MRRNRCLLILLFVFSVVTGLHAQEPTSKPATATSIATNAKAPEEAKNTPEATPEQAPKEVKKSAKKQPKPISEELLPILVLLVVVILVVRRLPKVDVGHSAEFRKRRTLNWLPLGLAYAFLYMGRYNIAVLKDVEGITGAEFGSVDFVGSLVYGFSFLLNGPLTDRWGGRMTILIATAGVAATNGLIGLLVLTDNMGALGTPVATLSILYGINMYFQSFGAVSIVKVNSAWFHVRERGTFGGIFGILISLGIYFAFDWGLRIALATSNTWLFWVPAILLLVFFVLCFIWVYDHPSQAGLQDFDPGDASSGDEGPRLPALTVIKKMLSSRIILIIALIEFCSGFLRQGILKWYRDFARGVDISDSFVYDHWGMVSCIAGIIGGIFAGLISDHLFQSRRGPVSAVLYGIMLAGAMAIFPALGFPYSVSWIIFVMAMAIIGVHGMLSGTASQDFGGKKNAGIAVGLIDGFVYLGSAAQAILYGSYLPAKGSPEANVVSNWYAWPGAMIPVALLGLLLATRVWNAKPQPKGGGH